MSLRICSAGVRAGIVLGLGAFLVAGASRAGNIANSTLDFSLPDGYVNVSNQSGSSLTLQGLFDSGGGNLDIFHNVAASGGTVNHSYAVHITNITAIPVTSYSFHLGVSNLNWWQVTDNDADAQPDRIDVDIDNDGILNASDNAPWVHNVSQTDLDGDTWGDVVDFRTTNANVPINSVGGTNPLPFTPDFIAFNASASIVFAGIPSSDTFLNALQNNGDLVFHNGTLAPGATAIFNFNVAVPDGLQNDGFVLRQSAEVPEPAAVALLALVPGALGMRRSRSRAS